MIIARGGGGSALGGPQEGVKKHKICALGRKGSIKKDEKRRKKTRKDAKSTGFDLKKHKNDDF